MAADDVESFIALWNLQDVGADLLRSLSKELQDDCIKNFKVNQDIVDINGRFIAFARSRVAYAAKHGADVGAQGIAEINQTHHAPKENPARRTEAGGTPDIEMNVVAYTFCQQWNLEGTPAAALLNKLPERLLDDVVQNFHPKETPRNMHALINSFIESRALRYKGQFAEDHGLTGTDAETFLMSMTGPLLLDVIANWRPTEVPRNPAALFISFANSRMKHMGAQMPTQMPLPVRHVAPTPHVKYQPASIIAQFAIKNGIPAAVVEEELAKIYSSVLIEEILTCYNPTTQPEDPERLFRSFCHSRIQGFIKKTGDYSIAQQPGGHGTFETGPQLRQQQPFQMRPRAPRRPQRGVPLMEQFEDDAGVDMDDPATQEFCKKFQLNNDSMLMIACMPSRQFEAVKEKFNPPENTMNMDNLFARYVSANTCRGVKRPREA